MHQDATWYGGRPQRSPVPPKGAEPPIFGLRLWRPNGCILDGDPAPLSKKGAEPPPQFSAHLDCGQTSRCIRMPLGMEVGLCVRRGPAPPQNGGGATQIFGSCLLWPNGWMDQDGTWHGNRPKRRRLYVRWRPSSFHKKGVELPIFGPFYTPSTHVITQQYRFQCTLIKTHEVLLNNGANTVDTDEKNSVVFYYYYYRKHV